MSDIKITVNVDEYLALKKSMMPIVKGMGMMNLFKDVRGAMKAL